MTGPRRFKCGLFRDAVEFHSRLVDLIVCVRGNGGGRHCRTLRGERFLGLVSEDIAQVRDSGIDLHDITRVIVTETTASYYVPQQFITRETARGYGGVVPVGQQWLRGGRRLMTLPPSLQSARARLNIDLSEKATAVALFAGPGGSGVPAGQVAGGDTVVGAVAGVAVNRCLVIFLPEDLVVLIEKQQFTGHVEEHL